MSRNTDAAVTSASQEMALRFRLLMNIESLSGGSFYACTGDRFIYTMGNTYSPVGHLGGIEKIQEDADPFPRAVRAWITLQNTIALQAALAESLYRKRVIIHRTFLSSSYTAQGTPQIAFKGLIDKARIDNSQDRGNYIEVEIETRLKQQPAGAYMTKQFFQTFVSTTTDVFLDFIHDIPYYEPAWGGFNPYMPYGPGGDM